MQWICPIEKVKTIKKHVNSDWMSDTNRITHDTVESPKGEKGIMVMPERKIGTRWPIDMRQNIDVINNWMVTG